MPRCKVIYVKWSESGNTATLESITEKRYQKESMGRTTINFTSFGILEY